MRGACTCLHLGKEVQKKKQKERVGGKEAVHCKQKRKRRQTKGNIVSNVSKNTTQEQVMLSKETAKNTQT